MKFIFKFFLVLFFGLGQSFILLAGPPSPGPGPGPLPPPSLPLDNGIIYLFILGVCLGVYFVKNGITNK